MITLPYPPRKAFIRSLWVVSNAIASLMVSIAVALMFGPVWLVPVGLLFGGLILLGYRWTEPQIKLYRAWNRFARGINRLGFQWILFLSHRLLLRAIGGEGSKFEGATSSGDHTRWSGYPESYSSASASSQFSPVEEVQWSGWIGEYLRWARGDGNLWALWLLPFLMSLSLFRQENESNAPSNIYTLF